ncbi:MAG TPA: hypothetical protein VEH86_05595 [Candidatus Acidoferrum sp.]|nr:hypothetical protein [Candidatus Acidoferrum sp.]
MPWKSIAMLIVFLLGIVLFLYGANYYEAVTGWIGVFLIVAAIVAYLVMEVYVILRKRGS